MQKFTHIYKIQQSPLYKGKVNSQSTAFCKPIHVYLCVCFTNVSIYKCFAGIWSRWDHHQLRWGAFQQNLKKEQLFTVAEMRKKNCS